MKVKAIKKMPLRITIPKITSKQHRDLQAGKEVDVDSETAAYLFENNYVEKIAGGKVDKHGANDL